MSGSGLELVEPVLQQGWGVGWEGGWLILGELLSQESEEEAGPLGNSPCLLLSWDPLPICLSDRQYNSLSVIQEDLTRRAETSILDAPRACFSSLCIIFILDALSSHLPGTGLATLLSLHIVGHQTPEVEGLAKFDPCVYHRSKWQEKGCHIRLKGWCQEHQRL